MSQSPPSPFPDMRVERVAAPLRHSVTESIRHAIAIGHFKPGARLPERLLCETTGVSRTLVREALRQLESEGLIEVVPHRGPVVATLTRKEAADLYRVRSELEGLAAELFAENANDQDLGLLQAALDLLRNQAGSDDALARLRAKNAFYESLIAGTGNAALGDSLRLLNSRVTVLRATSLGAEGRTEQSARELQDLVDALRARDPVAARKLAVEHVRAAAQIALRTLE
ncbi:GntR family transcriptional regulator [Pseudogemmobacter sonorensis]|uniref:GntR family transcriptional regulator n=1 Tax=Pseudogemmobacter sonorensis TaxID=2989681 RepID=UPI0036C262A3